MPKATPTKFGHLTDTELVLLIKDDQIYLGEVYKRCKSSQRKSITLYETL